MSVHLLLWWLGSKVKVLMYMKVHLRNNVDNRLLLDYITHIHTVYWITKMIRYSLCTESYTLA